MTHIDLEALEAAAYHGRALDPQTTLAITAALRTCHQHIDEIGATCDQLLGEQVQVRREQMRLTKLRKALSVSQ